MKTKKQKIRVTFPLLGTIFFLSENREAGVSKDACEVVRWNTLLRAVMASNCGYKRAAERWAVRKSCREKNGTRFRLASHAGEFCSQVSCSLSHDQRRALQFAKRIRGKSFALLRGTLAGVQSTAKDVGVLMIRCASRWGFASDNRDDDVGKMTASAIRREAERSRGRTTAEKSAKRSQLRGGECSLSLSLSIPRFFSLRVIRRFGERGNRRRKAQNPRSRKRLRAASAFLVSIDTRIRARLGRFFSRAPRALNRARGMPISIFWWLSIPYASSNARIAPSQRPTGHERLDLYFMHHINISETDCFMPIVPAR